MINKNQNIIADEYELEMIETLHNNEWESIENLEEEKKRYATIALNTLKNLQTIQIKLQKEDIEAIQKRSNEFGIPFQNMISAILHNFAVGKINLKFE